MPIYEFICTDCHDSFEQLLAYSATRKPACPFCGSERARRKLSAPAIHFKGSDFYLTESRKAAESRNAKEMPDKGESKSRDDADAGGPSEGGSSDGNGATQSDSSRRDARKAAQSDSDKIRATAGDT